MNKNTKQRHPQPPDRYCTYCGMIMMAKLEIASLFARTERSGYPNFDDETGWRLFFWAYHCPKAAMKIDRWWRRHRHDHFAVGEPFPLNTLSGSATWHAKTETIPNDSKRQV